METVKNMFKMTDEEIAQISGGTDAESQEIMEYIRAHDPNGYAFIVNSKRPQSWSMLRYLYDHGVPLIFYAPHSSVSNTYFIGDKDDMSTNQQVSHAELMAMIREKIR